MLTSSSTKDTYSNYVISAKKMLKGNSNVSCINAVLAQR